MYITINDITDKLLSVSEHDVAEANLFIEDMAVRMGVDVEDVQNPPTFAIRRLAVCFACYNSCLSCVGTDASTNFDGGNRQDIYAQKLEFYKKEIESIKDKLTMADFTGRQAGGSNISLWRA